MKQVGRVMLISFFVNLLLTCFKFIFGLIGKSSALVADAIHSFSDLSTDIVSIVGNKMASKPADAKHPYGHGKIEYVTSLFIGIVVLFLGVSLILSSIHTPTTIPSAIVIVVSGFTLCVKYLLSHYLIVCGKKYNNCILIASGKESSADVISSIFVLISSICMQYSKNFSFLRYADMVASILVGLFIVATGFSLVKENISVILGEQETDDSILKQIHEIILSDYRILKIDNLVILKYGALSSLTCDLSMDGNSLLKDAHDVIDEIEKRIKRFNPKYQYITIHINPSM